jgi:DNA-binding NarL/FixJ family response regulator
MRSDFGQSHCRKPPPRWHEQLEKLLLTGMSLKEIAGELKLSLSAVKGQASSIYRNNGVQDRIQLMAKVIKEK